MRGDVTTFYTNAEGILFQFTPLREGRPGTAPEESALLGAFQFTPLREGRRVVEYVCPVQIRISIHAPT